LSEEIIDVKRNCRYLFLISILLLFCTPFAAAQGSATVAIGFGSTHAKASAYGIQYAGSTYTNDVYSKCTLYPSDPSCYATRTLDGFFLGLGADIMPSQHYGFGFNISLMPAKRTYGEYLKYRQTFFEFNGIYAPINKKRAVLKLTGGIGGTKTGFTYEYTSAINSQSVPEGSSNHFQLHAGVGVELYVTRNAFIRPQFDFRYIPNFAGITGQFGSQAVPAGMIWVGVRTSGR
jgi:hypothetical protein